MTLIASLLFVTAFAASIGVVVMTISKSMPRITEVIEMEFAPAVQIERRIFFGKLKCRSSAQVIAFPSVELGENEFRLAA